MPEAEMRRAVSLAVLKAALFIAAAYVYGWLYIDDAQLHVEAWLAARPSLPAAWIAPLFFVPALALFALACRALHRPGMGAGVERDRVMTIANVVTKVLATLLLWPILAISLGIVASTGKSYGQADYFLLSFVLGAVGGVCQLAYLLIEWCRAQTGRGIAIWAGALCGVATFSLMTLALDHRLYFPHDAHDGKLLAFLVGGGVGIACLLRLLFRLLTPRVGGPGRREGAVHEDEDLHPYVSVGLGGSDSLGGADRHDGD